MTRTFVLGLLASACLSTTALASPGPTPAAPNAPIPAARDVAYPGVIKLDVDASDFHRRIVRVRETIPVSGPDMVLLYPQWIPGGHAGLCGRPGGRVAAVADRFRDGGAEGEQGR